MAPVNSRFGENRKRVERKREEVEWRGRWCVPMSHPILRIKWGATPYVRPEISHTHKPTNYR